MDKFEIELDKTELNFEAKKDGAQYQILLDTESKDYSMPIYPLHVLSTNRMCDTMISRKVDAGKFRIISDLGTIRSLSGLFAGLLPYTICYCRNFIDYQVFKKEDGLFMQ